METFATSEGQNIVKVLYRTAVYSRIQDWSLKDVSQGKYWMYFIFRYAHLAWMCTYSWYTYTKRYWAISNWVCDSWIPKIYLRVQKSKIKSIHYSELIDKILVPKVFVPKNIPSGKNKNLSKQWKHKTKKRLKSCDKNAIVLSQLSDYGD